MDFNALATPWGFGITLLIAIVIIALSFRFGRVSVNSGGVTLGKDDDERPAIPEKLLRDVIQLVQRTAAHYSIVAQLRDDGLGRMMRFFEEVEINISGTFKTAFRGICDKKQLDHEVVGHEVQRFSAALKAIMRDVKDLCRNYFRNNHFYSYSDATWAEYVRLKKSTLPQMVADGFDVLWSAEHLRRDDIRTLSVITNDEIETMIDALFMKAREISKETHAKELQELEDYQEYCIRMTGRKL